MTTIAVIPARFGSTRFPGKPLVRDTGKYLIQHVYERVSEATSIDRVTVATDDERIRAAVESFGGDCVMTRADHPSGTDRVAEVAAEFDEQSIILNVQGDEPEIDSADLDSLIRRMHAEPDVDMGTLCCPFPEGVDPRDPNRVKVVMNDESRALYFSRSLIPYPRDVAGAPQTNSDWLLHVGVYAYRRDALIRLSKLNPSALEETERLEQLRALHHGMSIAVVRVDGAAPGIDTPEDYAAFKTRISSDGP